MRKATLDRIESAVLELFTTRDFNSVALIEVARCANVSLQTIYKYFGSKEQLVAYVLDTTLRRLASRMIDHLEGIEDYRERLRKTLWVMLDYFDKHPKVILLLTAAIPASRYQDLPVYESPELMGAFLGMLKAGQQKVYSTTLFPAKCYWTCSWACLAGWHKCIFCARNKTG